MAAWLAEYCTDRQQTPFVEAVGALVNRLSADRLQAFSEPVQPPEATGLRLYAATLRQAQDRLVELGLLQGAASGELDAETQEALRSFQAANGLDVTGLPDQPTLARLLQPRPTSKG